MIESAIANLLFKLILIVVGILVGRLTLYWFDRFFMPAEFKTWLREANDNARALYFALRFLGICLLVGLILG